MEMAHSSPSATGDPVLYPTHTNPSLCSMETRPPGENAVQTNSRTIRLLPYDQLFLTAHDNIYIVRASKGINDKLSMVSQTGIAKCIICYDLVKSEQAWRPQNSSCLLPRHCVCAECLHQYIISKISVGQVNGNRTISCPCPNAKCVGTLSMEQVSASLSMYGSERYIEQFILFSKNVEVATDPNKMWCPNNVCKTVVSFQPGARRAHCHSCHSHFCTKCGQPHTRFLTCDMVRPSIFLPIIRPTV